MISLIVAVAGNNVIGKDNKLPWHLPNDLRRFRKLTENKTIVMGRKTFESLPNPLPNREHIVISRSLDIKKENIITKSDLKEVLSDYQGLEKDCFVIGGASIYNLAIYYCNKIYVTKIYNKFEGDTYLNLNLSAITFNVVNMSKLYNHNELIYRFVDYERI